MMARKGRGETMKDGDYDEEENEPEDPKRKPKDPPSG